MILIDSNILIDIFDRDDRWFDWSAQQLRRLGNAERLAVPQIVVAEVGPRFEGLSQFCEALEAFDISVAALTDDAMFAAGTAFRRYVVQRKPGSAKTILADFLIGGQAMIEKASVLTRDAGFLRTYFPDVPLVTPTKDEA